VDLEWGPLSLVSTTEELLERKCSGSGLEIREYGLGGPPQKLAITSPTGCGRLVGIVRSRTPATEFSLFWGGGNTFLREAKQLAPSQEGLRSLELVNLQILLITAHNLLSAFVITISLWKAHRSSDGTRQVASY
jgi:hypothetical protein